MGGPKSFKCLSLLSLFSGESNGFGGAPALKSTIHPWNPNIPKFLTYARIYLKGQHPEIQWLFDDHIPQLLMISTIFGPISIIH